MIIAEALNSIEEVDYRIDAHDIFLLPMPSPASIFKLVSTQIHGWLSFHHVGAIMWPNS